MVISNLRNFCWVRSPDASRSRDKQKKCDFPRRDKPLNKGPSCVLLPNNSINFCMSLWSPQFSKKPGTENLAVLFNEISYPIKGLVLQFLQSTPSDTRHSQHKAGLPWTEWWRHDFCTAQSASTMRLDHACAWKSCLACTAAFGVRQDCFQVFWNQSSSTLLV